MWDSGCCSHLRALLQKFWPLIIHDCVGNFLNEHCGRLWKCHRCAATENRFSKKTTECDIICHDQDKDHLLNAEPGRGRGRGRELSSVLYPMIAHLEVPSTLFADGERTLLCFGLTSGKFLRNSHSFIFSSDTPSISSGKCNSKAFTK